MNKNKLLRFSCFIFSVIVIVLSIPFSVGAISNIDNTGAYKDLQTMGVDLSTCKISPADKTPKLIHFLEYGYDARGNQSDFGLYIYVFNVSGDTVINHSEHNTVQLVTKSSSGKVTFNEKCKLQFISASTAADGEGLNNAFYKFKITVPASIMFELSKDKRVYNIVDLELQYKGESSLRVANISNSYICTGYQANRGPLQDNGAVSDKSTHYCYAQNLETISIELHPATWKTVSSDKGDHYQYEVSSVYFSIPDYYLEKYGNIADEDFKGLDSVEGEFYEYKVNGIVSDNLDLLNRVEEFVGKRLPLDKYLSSRTITVFNNEYWEVANILDAQISGLTGATISKVWYNRKIPFGFVSSFKDNSGDWHSKIFNRRFFAGNSGFWQNEEHYFDSEDSLLSEYVDTLFVLNNAIYSTSSGLLVSTEDLYSSIMGSDGSFYHMNEVDSGRKQGYNSYLISVDGKKLNDQIAAYCTSDKHLKNFFSGLPWKPSTDADGYSAMHPIVMLDSSDFQANYEILADELFVCKEDLSSVENFVDSQEDRTTYLMRFAITDYYCDEIDVTYNNGDEYVGNHYYFEKTIFQNFDVLSFTYKNEENIKTVVPVSSKPANVVGNITEDPDDELSERVNGWLGDEDASGVPNWLRLLIIVFGSLFVVLVFTKLYGFFNKQRSIRLDSKLKKTELKQSEANLTHSRDDNERKWRADRRDEDRNTRDWRKDDREQHKDDREKAELKLKKKQSKREDDRNQREWNEDRRREERHQKGGKKE